MKFEFDTHELVYLRNIYSRLNLNSVRDSATTRLLSHTIELGLPVFRSSGSTGSIPTTYTIRYRLSHQSRAIENDVFNNK